MSPSSVHVDAQESLQCLRLQFMLMRRRACSVSVFSSCLCAGGPVVSPSSVHVDAQESLQCLRLQSMLMRRRACSVSVFSSC